MRASRTLVTSDVSGDRWRMLAGNGKATAGGPRKGALEQDEPSYTDPHGVKWFPYMVEFSSEDGRFAVELWGTSDDHAEKQLRAMRDTAALQGRVVAVV